MLINVNLGERYLMRVLRDLILFFKLFCKSDIKSWGKKQNNESKFYLQSVPHENL